MGSNKRRRIFIGFAVVGVASVATAVWLFSEPSLPYRFMSDYKIESEIGKSDGRWATCYVADFDEAVKKAKTEFLTKSAKVDIFKGDAARFSTGETTVYLQKGTPKWWSPKEFPDRRSIVVVPDDNHVTVIINKTSTPTKIRRWLANFFPTLGGP